MTARIPEKHPLYSLFSAALDKAFREHADLYSPGVSVHLREDVLCDFVHADRLYRLKSLEGDRIADLSRMIEVSRVKEGPERRLEVDTYIGDFTLFMGGFFPAGLRQQRWSVPEALVSKVGPVFVKFAQPLDYYTAEGRNAYGRAAETARIFAPDERETYSLLAEHFDRYLVLLGRVKALLSDEAAGQGALEAGEG